MYDTINLKLLQSEAPDVDFLRDIPNYLQNVGNHFYNNGETRSITGNVGRLEVSLSSTQIKVGEGSLCKLFLGDNFKTLTRRDVKEAIVKLSDMLHLSMKNAKVIRLDVGTNIMCSRPPNAYYRYLGYLSHAIRLQNKFSLYYQQTGGQLCFYDKVKEQRHHRQAIPPLYDGQNVLRYEQRFSDIGRLAAKVGMGTITAEKLYDVAFYMKVINIWKESYFSIQREETQNLNFPKMKTLKDLYKYGCLLVAKQAGGLEEYMAIIDEWRVSGEITYKQAHDLKKAVRDACTGSSGTEMQSEGIEEIDKRIEEAVKYYR